MPLLDWVNRNQAEETATQVPYHLLKFEKSYGDIAQAKENLIIQGDNLQALKALLPLYGGKVKCIFIDPPYNTQSAFEHYDDKLEHAQWLSMMYPRLQLLKELLAEDGSIWITLDDNEAHYLKVLCDEVFGRKNFISSVIWQKKYAASNDAHWFSNDHDNILVYSKDSKLFKVNRLERDEKSNKAYKNLDNDSRGLWQSDNYTCNKSINERPNLYYPITNPNTGEIIYPKKTAVWRYSQETHLNHVKDNLIYWGKEGKNSVPRFKRFLSSIEDKGATPQSIWLWQDVGHNQDAKREQLNIHKAEPFSTPKPEKLIQRIIQIATHTNDIVLDSFLGSGTTSAVAHKMGRCYIGIEMGEHAKTHVIPRLEKVIEGEQGGISSAINWQGGGGFSFYTLGSPIFDDNGFLNADVKFKDLASYVWWLETKLALNQIENFDNPFLGIHEGTAYYLLYNGILGDRRPNGGNVLTSSVLNYLNECHVHDGKRIVIGEASRLSPARLEALNIEFKQIPYSLYGNKAK
jgi:adenine-specific DNA-methyltransferase